MKCHKTKNKKVPRNILVSINTQSELIAELSDPKLLGALLHTVNSSFNSKQEGRVTTVVTKKARYQKRPKIMPCWVPNPRQGIATVTMEKNKEEMFLKHLPCFQMKEHPCVFLTQARLVSNSWHMQDRCFLNERKGSVK